MSESINVQQTCEMFQYVGSRIMESKPFLTELDSAIGDGDHGVGMAIGFTEAMERLNTAELKSINDIFRTIGMAMINSMGGASGIIFGTMFVGGLKHVSEFERLDLNALSSIMEHALKAVKDRGKAEVGDKTMIDALEPAVQTLKRCSDRNAGLREALREAAESARLGMESTKNHVAKFGRAKTLGERSIGIADAGAASVWIIFRSMNEWLEGEMNNE